ncbi:hypothetical protein [uncultured phage MedDCM-OCT-S04-C148]|nr:hypothetical protein [uncultured phage MedDCM-OCT-S04-C148]
MWFVALPFFGSVHRFNQLARLFVVACGYGKFKPVLEHGKHTDRITGVFVNGWTVI